MIASVSSSGDVVVTLPDGGFNSKIGMQLAAEPYSGAGQTQSLVSEGRMVDWAFERDTEGMWRWMHVDTRGMTRSRKRYVELWDCVEDAKKHGLEGRTAQAGRTPALLH